MKKIVCFPPWNVSFELFFGLTDSKGSYSEASLPWNTLFNKLQESGILLCDFHQTKAEEYEDVIFMDNTNQWKLLNKLKTKRWIFIAMEPPSIIPSNKPKYIKKLARHCDYIITSSSFQFIEDNITNNVIGTMEIREVDDPSCLTPFSARKLSCMIGRGGFASSQFGAQYSVRTDVADFFETNDLSKEFALYGIEWDENRYKNIYHGVADSKLKTYSEYKFAFAFNNDSEVPSPDKLFDCLMYRIVPIGIYDKEHVPNDIYIDYNNFTSMDELYLHISTMDELTWKEYLSRAQSFLKTDMAKHYDMSSSFLPALASAILGGNIKTRKTFIDVTAIILIRYIGRLYHVFKRRGTVRYIVNKFFPTITKT